MIGICQRRELVVRRLRSPFWRGGCPRDFEQSFRESELRVLRPDILFAGQLGSPETRGRVVSGANNPREGGPNQLDWGGNDPIHGDDRSTISSMHSSTETHSEHRAKKMWILDLKRRMMQTWTHMIRKGIAL